MEIELTAKNDAQDVEEDQNEHETGENQNMHMKLDV